MMTLLFIVALGGLSLLALVVTARWLEAQLWRASLSAYQLGLPIGLSVNDVTAWLGHVVAGTHAPRWRLLPPSPMALEITATAEGIRHVLLVPRRMARAMLSALRAAMPGVRLTPVDEYLSGRPQLVMAAEGRLTNLSRPLAHERAERANAALLASLSLLRSGEIVVVQWIVVGAATPAPATARSGSAEVVATLLGGDSPTPDAETVQAARRKQAEPLLQAAVRVGVAAPDRARTYALFGQVWGTLRGLNAPGVRVVRRLLPEWVVAARLTGLAVPLTVWPLLVNARELAGLIGLPIGATSVPGLPRAAARQLPPPLAMPQRGTVIAVSTYPGMSERPLALATEDRLRHTWVIGPTGVGKSTLLCGQIVQDMEAGRGVVVIDPKGGDLVRDVLARVPKARRDDVVVIDPSATDRPVGLNVLDAARGEHAEELGGGPLGAPDEQPVAWLVGTTHQRRPAQRTPDLDAHAGPGRLAVYAGGAAGTAPERGVSPVRHDSTERPGNDPTFLDGLRGHVGR